MYSRKVMAAYLGDVLFKFSRTRNTKYTHYSVDILFPVPLLVKNGTPCFSSFSSPLTTTAP
jgi:hypothetical protein